MNSLIVKQKSNIQNDNTKCYNNFLLQRQKKSEQLTNQKYVRQRSNKNFKFTEINKNTQSNTEINKNTQSKDNDYYYGKQKKEKQIDQIDIFSDGNFQIEEKITNKLNIEPNLSYESQASLSINMQNSKFNQLSQQKYNKDSMKFLIKYLGNSQSNDNKHIQQIKPKSKLRLKQKFGFNQEKQKNIPQIDKNEIKINNFLTQNNRNKNKNQTLKKAKNFKQLSQTYKQNNQDNDQKQFPQMKVKNLQHYLNDNFILIQKQQQILQKNSEQKQQSNQKVQRLYSRNQQGILNNILFRNKQNLKMTSFNKQDKSLLEKDYFNDQYLKTDNDQDLEFYLRISQF